MSLPGVKHKVIGLVSGGKDSCFNLLHAVANGHEIVALATLTPPKGTDELDSHMYQSVGTDLPPLIAQAMGLPHYTHVITGGAVERGAEYGSREGKEGREGDETEDLTALLQDVMKAHPEATALSSGAILSNYQRLRIEHVCGRLGLASLAYLWQSEQLPLVSRMVGSGLEAVLVKVAGVGLGVKQLGKSLGQLLPMLTRLEMQYGAHPAGEGGEYETLTLDCPLFSHRLVIRESVVVITDPEPYTVAYLRITDAGLDQKEGWVKPTVAELRELLGLEEEEGKEGLDEQSVEALEALERVQAQPLEEGAGETSSTPSSDNVRFGRSGRWFSASSEGSSRDDDVGDELRRCMDAIKTRLAESNLSLLHAAHITLLLSSMSLFPAANAAYVQYFGTSPPSRACVAVPLPAGQHVRVEVVGFDDAPVPGAEALVGGRSALHVQGISYWAPANIGPYSQAVTVDGRLQIAGQIPLVPSSLTLPPYPSPPASPYPHQATLALQHVRRIVSALRSPAATGGGWTGWGESVVCWWALPENGGGEGALVAQKAWTLWADENDWSRVPAIFVRAAELPRAALVEYQVNMHTGRRQVDTPEDDDEEDDGVPKYASDDVRGAHWETCRAPEGRSGARAAIFLPDAGAMPELGGVHELAGVLSRAVGVKVYHLPSVQPFLEPLVQQIGKTASLTAIPVLDVQDRKGQTYRLALEVFAA